MIFGRMTGKRNRVKLNMERGVITLYKLVFKESAESVAYSVLSLGVWNGLDLQQR